MSYDDTDHDDFPELTDKQCEAIAMKKWEARNRIKDLESQLATAKKQIADMEVNMVSALWHSQEMDRVEGRVAAATVRLGEEIIAHAAAKAEAADARKSFCVQIGESKRLREALENCLSSLKELDELDWEPQGRPFNWDEVMDIALAVLGKE